MQKKDGGAYSARYVDMRLYARCYVARWRVAARYRHHAHGDVYFDYAMPLMLVAYDAMILRAWRDARTMMLFVREACGDMF